MKKTMVSLVAAAALTTGAFAADKGIDIVTNGQAVVYYQTADVTGSANDFFDEESSSANVGIQLDLAADLKNNFTFGAQLTYLGTAGLENNLVSDTRQGATQTGETIDNIALTKIFVAKKVANTTVKIGRQELPKSLSPLAYSESWNVFKNTFDAVVAVNTDIPNTTVVAAYVSGGTGVNDLTATGDLAGGLVDGGAYMLTAQTTVIPMTTLTASYYHLTNIDSDLTANNGIDGALSADAFWIDAQIAPKDAPMGLNIGLQYGNIDVDTTPDATTTYGIKASIEATKEIKVCAAYTTVDDKGLLTVTNVGTGVKSPLYTQMIANQGSIAALDNDTWMLKGSYSLGDMGTVTAQYASTDDNTVASDDLNELDVIYTVKAGGVDYLAAYVMQDFDATADQDIIRLWARYNF